MAKIEGVSRVISALKGLARASGTDRVKNVEVGYRAAYAIYVHEDLTAHHKVGQAKYLEQPYREMRSELVSYIQEQLSRPRNRTTLEVALLRAGLKLQRASQKLVPVDTGNLKASAYTKLV